MRSDPFKEFPGALAKFQGSITSPPKKKTATVQMKAGGSYSFSYADLADILEHVRKPLAENGLSWTSEVSDDGMQLITTIWHSSGEWIATKYPLGGAQDTKGFAGEITYARRYSVTMLLGIAADEDTDGAPPANAKDYKTGGKNAPAPKPAVTYSPGPSPRQGPGGPTTPQGAPTGPTPRSAPSVASTSPTGAPAQGPTPAQLAGPAEREHLIKLAEQHGWKGMQVVAYMQAAFNKGTTADLTLPQYQEMAAVVGSKTPELAIAELTSSQPFGEFKDRR